MLQTIKLLDYQLTIQSVLQNVLQNIYCASVKTEHFVGIRVTNLLLIKMCAMDTLCLLIMIYHLTNVVVCCVCLFELRTWWGLGYHCWIECVFPLKGICYFDISILVEPAVNSYLYSAVFHVYTYQCDGDWTRWILIIHRLYMLRNQTRDGGY